MNRSGFTLLELLVALVVGALFLTGALMMCALHRSLWFETVRLGEAEQGLVGPALILARALRSAGSDPKGTSSAPGITCTAGEDGACEKLTLRSDHRGKTPGSGPDGDRDDPGERLTYTYDAGAMLIRENGQPFAERVVPNPGGEPFFAIDSPTSPRLATVTLTGWGCAEAHDEGTPCLTETITLKVALRTGR